MKSSGMLDENLNLTPKAAKGDQSWRRSRINLPLKDTT